MRLPSVQALVEELSAEVAARARADAVEGLLMPFHAPTPPVSVGISAGNGPRDYRLAVRSESAEAMEPIVDRARGEADARVVRVEAIPPNPNDPVAEATPDWLNQERRPLEGGVAISPRGSGWVGTLGALVRRLRDGALCGLSNAHVLSDMGLVTEGTPILQPFGGEAVGVLGETVPVRPAGNVVDAALAVLRSVELLPGMIAGRPLRAPVEVGPEILGAEVFKQGRTTGLTTGRATATGLRNLAVNYGGGGRVYSYDDQVEFKGDGADFSAAGDSGSLISLATGEPVALLFAGGGELTFGNPILAVLQALGIEILLGGMS